MSTHGNGTRFDLFFIFSSLRLCLHMDIPSIIFIGYPHNREHRCGLRKLRSTYFTILPAYTIHYNTDRPLGQGQWNDCRLFDIHINVNVLLLKKGESNQDAFSNFLTFYELPSSIFYNDCYKSGRKTR